MFGDLTAGQSSAAVASVLGLFGRPLVLPGRQARAERIEATSDRARVTGRQLNTASSCC
jgi:hypothetical protein